MVHKDSHFQNLLRDTLPNNLIMGKPLVYAHKLKLFEWDL